MLDLCGLPLPAERPDWPALAGWRVRPGSPYGHHPANSRSIVVRGEPEGEVIIVCTRTPEGVDVLTPGSVWKSRQKLGFTRKVQTEGGGFVLRHTVRDAKYIGPGKIRNTPVRHFEGSDLDHLQRI